MAVKQKVVVIGAGPGGLTASMILTKKGYDVTVYERKSEVGGRNAELKFDGFRFDTGPTFLMMKFVLDEVFQLAGKKSEDYLKFTKLDPMYRLDFSDFAIDASDDTEQMRAEIEKYFPGEGKGLDRYLREEKTRYERMLPCLQKDYSSISAYLRPIFIKALPYLALNHTMMGLLSNYFKSEKLALSFTFQSKYLGMSPWDCPGAFAMIPYVEHSQGIYHVEGGLSEISNAMAKVVVENGGKIKTSTAVRKIVCKGKRASAVELENGETIEADAIVLNSDFGYSMANLFDDGVITKWSSKRLSNELFSCSTFMLYLGLDKVYGQPHHTIVFSKDYRKMVKEIFSSFTLPLDPSAYVRNASINDKTIAPAGKSSVYVLVPVPNNRSKIDWKKEKQAYRDKIIKLIEERTNMKDLSKHIVAEKIITPQDWAGEYNVYEGATFNLGHSLMQMLYMRPHNRFEELKGMYLVGGGTHPGSGLPTIYESGRISASLVDEDLKER